MAFGTWWEEEALATLATSFLASHLQFLREGWLYPGWLLLTIQAFLAPASWETHPLIGSNVLATDHDPSQCQEAVAQIADLGRESESTTRMLS